MPTVEEATRMFEKTATGRIKFSPVYGWTTMPLGNTALLVKLDYYLNPDAMSRRELSSLQLTLGPEQCRELGTQLLRMADHLAKQKPTPRG